MLAEISKFTPEENKQYNKSIENMGDYLNTITTASEDSKAIGIAIGREEGKAECFELTKVALKMLKDGLAIDQICKETGMTEGQVAELQALL